MNAVRLRAADLAWRIVVDEVIVLDLRTSNYFLANRTAAGLWPTLVRGATAQVLAAQVATEHGIPIEQAEADVRVLLEQMAERDLLEPSDDA
jgi:hypothetical protein